MAERAQHKASRILQIEQLLLDHSEGLTQAELARRLGVHRSTIHRDLLDLDQHFAVIETADGRIAVDRDSYLTDVRFTLHEAMAVHLATRLMATTTDKHNPNAASALRKLARALQKLAPFISNHVRASADVMDTDAQRHDPVYREVLETLTRAWSLGRKVRLTHQMPDKRSFPYTFAPYYIEPYPAGRTSHVIGWREPPGAVRTFKIERIRTIDLLDEPYTIPEDFDPRATLRDAWGIWYTESPPVEVVLRFHPRVAERVLETVWHRGESKDVGDDGWLTYRARIAEPREMLPWIRGWGSDVEVVAPPGLRRALVREATRLAALYEVADVAPAPLWQQLWGKLSRNKAGSHPLICHMLDVAMMMHAMWQTALTPGQRDQWAGLLRMDAEDAGRLLSFWAALHDLGKASPAFQRKWPAAEDTLTQAGLPFGRLYVKEFCPHGTVTAATLPSLLVAEVGLPKRGARYLARALGGHHGAWPTPAQDQSITALQRGGAEWDAVRRQLLVVLRQVLQPPAFAQWPFTRAEANAFLTWFSGLVSTADWLGSMETYFPYTDLPVDVEAYARQAETQARAALDALNWTAWQPPATSCPFADQFPFEPRDSQQAIIDLAETVEDPALVLIEAPTGSGKTEAALYLADVWARTQQQRGLYIAMPTMATSNQMHGRVAQWLERRHAQDETELLLVHSQARWVGAPPDITLHDEPDEDSVPTMAWFLPKKRSLLAPCGVGTVDQTLLSVLQARHFFVRLFGLSRKTVVFDEIHAYDTYMSTLFQRLLAWLHAMGTSVILLSATLPARTRRELLEAYAGRPLALPDDTYPAATWVTDGAAGCVPLPSPQDTPIALDWIDRDPEEVVGVLDRLLVDGGCAAVICNTVVRAQAVYCALRDAQIVPDEALFLFHARFPFGWRDRIERTVLGRFGKDGSRPDRAIVVATQVIEQSLDLDFDVMVSDLAPVDLLIQRVGRLHRHPGRKRPESLTTPSLVVAVDALHTEAPDFGRDTYVYERYLLLRTALVLRDRRQIQLPGEGPTLLEAVYGDAALPDAPQELERARDAMLHRQEQEVDAAMRRLVAEPDYEGLLSDTRAGLAEDDPHIHTALQALTRLGRPSISLVCLHQTPHGLNTEPDGNGCIVDPHRRPDSETTAAIVGATVNMSSYPVVSYFRDEEPPSGWRRHSLLRDHRLAVFEDGVCHLRQDLSLHLTRDFGLEVVA